MELTTGGSARASNPDAFHRSLRRYLSRVATALGVGLVSCTVDFDTPVSAYLAVDEKLDAFPDRDVALLWDEEHGWSLAVETHSGEDLLVFAYLNSGTVLPPTDLVVRFVTEAGAGPNPLAVTDPPAIRTASPHGNPFTEGSDTATQLAGVA